MNLADAGVVAVLVGLVVLGLRRGLIGQCLLLAATLASVLVAGAATYWTVGRAELEAPLETPLGRLIAPVTFFVALVIAAWVLQRLAAGVTRVVHRLPFASLDRLLGALVSMTIGVIILSLLFLGLVSVPWNNPVSREVRAARTAPLLLDAGWRLAEQGSRYLAVLEPLASRFEASRLVDLGETL